MAKKPGAFKGGAEPAYPGAECLRTAAPADHVAVSVVDRNAVPITGGWERFMIGGLVHVARRRIGRRFADAAGAARIRGGRHGCGRNCRRHGGN